ncbi:unnamed protein product, partial [Polarella glacialis]
ASNASGLPPFSRTQRRLLWPLSDGRFECGPSPDAAEVCGRHFDLQSRCVAWLWASADSGETWSDLGLRFTYAGEAFLTSGAQPLVAQLLSPPVMVTLYGKHFVPSPSLRCAFRINGRNNRSDSTAWLYTRALLTNGSTAVCPSPEPGLLGAVPMAGAVALTIDGQQLTNSLPFSFSAPLSTADEEDIDDHEVFIETPRIKGFGDKHDSLVFSVTARLRSAVFRSDGGAPPKDAYGRAAADGLAGGLLQQPAACRLSGGGAPQPVRGQATAEQDLALGEAGAGGGRRLTAAVTSSSGTVQHDGIVRCDFEVPRESAWAVLYRNRSVLFQESYTEDLRLSSNLKVLPSEMKVHLSVSVGQFGEAWTRVPSLGLLWSTTLPRVFSASPRHSSLGPGGGLRLLRVRISGANFVNSSRLGCRFGDSGTGEDSGPLQTLAVVGRAIWSSGESLVCEVETSKLLEGREDLPKEQDFVLPLFVSGDGGKTWRTAPEASVRFHTPMEILSVQPAWCPLRGGRQVVVRGRFLPQTPLLSCRFGPELPPVPATRISSEEVHCYCPSVASLVEDDQSDSPVRLLRTMELTANHVEYVPVTANFSYFSDPRIVSVSPSIGMADEGFTVTLAVVGWHPLLQPLAPFCEFRLLSASRSGAAPVVLTAEIAVLPGLPANGSAVHVSCRLPPVNLPKGLGSDGADLAVTVRGRWEKSLAGESLAVTQAAGLLSVYARATSRSEKDMWQSRSRGHLDSLQTTVTGGKAGENWTLRTTLQTLDGHAVCTTVRGAAADKAARTVVGSEIYAVIVEGGAAVNLTRYSDGALHKQLRSLPGGAAVDVAVFDGWVAVAGGGGSGSSVAVWSATSGALLLSLEAPGGTRLTAVSLGRLSGDGPESLLLALADQEGVVFTYALADAAAACLTGASPGSCHVTATALATTLPLAGGWPVVDVRLVPRTGLLVARGLGAGSGVHLVEATSGENWTLLAGNQDSNLSYEALDVEADAPPPNMSVSFRILVAMGTEAEVWSVQVNESGSPEPDVQLVSQLQSNHAAGSNVLAVSFGRSYLITGMQDGTATLWSKTFDGGVAGSVWVLKGVHKGALRKVGWKSSTEVVTASEDEIVGIWTYPIPTLESKDYLGLRMAPDWGFVAGNATPLSLLGGPEPNRSVAIVGVAWPRSVRAHCVWARERVDRTDNFVAVVHAAMMAEGPASQVLSELSCPLPAEVLAAQGLASGLHLGLSTDGGITALPFSLPLPLWERPTFLRVEPARVSRRGGMAVTFRGLGFPPSLRARCLLHLASSPEPLLVEASSRGLQSMACLLPKDLNFSLAALKGYPSQKLRFSVSFHDKLDWVLPVPEALSVEVVDEPDVAHWAPALASIATLADSRKPLPVHLKLAKESYKSEFEHWYCAWRSIEDPAYTFISTSRVVYLNTSFLMCPLPFNNYRNLHSQVPSIASFQLYFSLSPVPVAAQSPPAGRSSAAVDAAGLIPTAVVVRVVGNVRIFGPVPKVQPMPSEGQPEVAMLRFSGWGFASNLTIFARSSKPTLAGQAFEQEEECRLCVAESPSALLCPYTSAGLGLEEQLNVSFFLARSQLLAPQPPEPQNAELPSSPCEAGALLGVSSVMVFRPAVGPFSASPASHVPASTSIRFTITGSHFSLYAAHHCRFQLMLSDRQMAISGTTMEETTSLPVRAARINSTLLLCSLETPALPTAVGEESPSSRTAQGVLVLCSGRGSCADALRPSSMEGSGSLVAGRLIVYVQPELETAESSLVFVSRAPAEQSIMLSWSATGQLPVSSLPCAIVAGASAPLHCEVYSELKGFASQMRCIMPARSPSDPPALLGTPMLRCAGAAGSYSPLTAQVLPLLPVAMPQVTMQSLTDLHIDAVEMFRWSGRRRAAPAEQALAARRRGNDARGVGPPLLRLRISVAGWEALSPGQMGSFVDACRLSRTTPVGRNVPEGSGSKAYADGTSRYLSDGVADRNGTLSFLCEWTVSSGLQDIVPWVTKEQPQLELSLHLKSGLWMGTNRTVRMRPRVTGARALPAACVEQQNCPMLVVGSGFSPGAAYSCVYSSPGAGCELKRDGKLCTLVSRAQ